MCSRSPASVRRAARATTVPAVKGIVVTAVRVAKGVIVPAARVATVIATETKS